MYIGEIKFKAKESLRGRVIQSAGATLIYFLITGILPQIIDKSLENIIGKLPSDLILYGISLIISSALAVGVISYFFSFSDDREDTKISLLFSGFDSFLKVLIYQVLLILVISLVVIIGGMLGGLICYAANFNIAVMIVVSILMIALGIVIIWFVLRLFFVNFIFTDDKDTGIMTAVKRSFFLTKGYTVKLLLTTLSFILWDLACILIIPFFYVFPYMQLTYVNFYRELKKIKDVNNTYIEE